MDASGDVTDTAARAADRAFLGLELGPDGRTGRAPVTSRLLAPHQRFYGGAGVALASAAMEAATNRRLRWVTVQFVSSAGPDEQIDLTVDVEAHGRATSQLRVAARIGDRTLFNALGSTDEPSGGDAAGEQSDVAFATMPAAPAPEDCPEGLGFPPGIVLPPSQLTATEIRLVNPDGPNQLLWARLHDHDATRPAMLGYVADYVPLAVMRALGELGGGTSLDNTIRVGAPPRSSSPWVLVELRAQLAAGGYGHGEALLWSQTGELLGIASQTMRLRRIPG